MSDSSWPSDTKSEATDGDKDTSAAQPEQVAPTNSGSDSSQDQPAPGEKVTTPEGDSTQDGVQVGGLTYTVNDDGTRNYPDQQPVETTGDPTPLPEQIDAEAPQQTSERPGQ